MVVVVVVVMEAEQLHLQKKTLKLCRFQSLTQYRTPFASRSLPHIPFEFLFIFLTPFPCQDLFPSRLIDQLLCPYQYPSQFKRILATRSNAKSLGRTFIEEFVLRRISADFTNRTAQGAPVIFIKTVRIIKAVMGVLCKS